MKKIFLSTILLMQCAFSLTLDDLTQPMPFSGRLGISDKVESQVNVDIEKKPKPKKQFLQKTELKKEQIKEAKTLPEANKELNEETKTEDTVNDYQEDLKNFAQNNEQMQQDTDNTNNASYADLSLKKLAQDVSYELDLDEAKTASDLSILWAATTERSETMKYTIYKLSNPDEDKPNQSTIKKILKPIANFSSLAGASVAGDPYMATGALIGGGLINAFMKDDKEYNYKFSKVSDADMVLLVRKIDDLQKKLLDLYTDYKTKEQLAKMTEENFKKREEIYLNSQNKSKEELVIADVYYRNAKTSAQRAKDEYLTSRAILENLVGLEALNQIEKD